MTVAAGSRPSIPTIHLSPLTVNTGSDVGINSSLTPRPHHQISHFERNTVTDLASDLSMVEMCAGSCVAWACRCQWATDSDH
ncbi:hypothetical protein Bpfe_008754 [Biomphalaria pfeifferi]|uniref:Uncharacterized protein n=1 Tax=Biomphalaria pfeifferi TaxID=112525 RepID=A0AAD8BXW1_BIOPF|nr:hypothetical protein Bpfe_008754 [Biomphalaria pfeifferi]